jgi:anti-sigma B factor antagonist
MAFNATLTSHDTIAQIQLSGELDANAAPQFKEAVDQAIAQQPQRLVLMMQELEYMASAGLRVLIYAKQKTGSEIDIYMVGTQEMVLDTLQKTGFDQSVYMVESYAA